MTYAAALRVARFHTSNEFGDWITVLHTFTYCNALHQGSCSARLAPSWLAASSTARCSSTSTAS